MVPPLGRFERREEPKAQGGEFVEAYVAKRTKQISPTRALALDVSATSAGSVFEYIPCISVNWSLLSKGLRGGKSRSDREESLLRRMIASEDAKNPLKARKQKGIQGYGPAISARKKGTK